MARFQSVCRGCIEQTSEVREGWYEAELFVLSKKSLHLALTNSISRSRSSVEISLRLEKEDLPTP